MAVRDDFTAGEVLAAADLNDTFADKLSKENGYAFAETIYYTSNGTFTKATYPWLRAIRVKVQGAGGGGGGCEATGGGESAEGAGGGGGGYGEQFITDIAGLSASESITVGSGGAGASGGAANVGASGGNSVAFGVTGNGGFGGHGINAGSGMNFAQRGVGGEATGADLSVQGDDGNMGVVYEHLQTSMQNFGGGSFLAGVRNTGAASNTNGLDGQEYGGGGTGGRSRLQNSEQKTGGNGGDGIVIVELYS